MFIIKLAISFLLVKFTCAYVVAKFSTVDLPNCGVVIYLLWSDILFSTAAKAVVVTA